MSPRLRRLAADADQLERDFSGHAHIRVTPIGPAPPEQYRIAYQLRGVTLAPDSSQPAFHEQFTVLLTLPATYPRSKPLVITESLVFHPNFGSRAGDEVCIADYWSPAQTLSDIVVQIGEMLQFQDFNVKSPLNATAARWADQNRSILPIGRVEVRRASDVSSPASE